MGRGPLFFRLPNLKVAQRHRRTVPLGVQAQTLDLPGSFAGRTRFRAQPLILGALFAQSPDPLDSVSRSGAFWLIQTRDFRSQGRVPRTVRYVNLTSFLIIERRDHMAKKKDPSRQAAKPEGPQDLGGALKNAIEQIRLLERQRDKLLEQLSFLEITLQDLAASRLDNKKLRSQKEALQNALRECQESLAKLKGQAS
jgi:hypothetical protein